jgi:predicted amidohydrolase
MVVHKVAVIQLYPKVASHISFTAHFADSFKPLQMEDNHQRACKFIREAASQGAVLAVLPE